MLGNQKGPSLAKHSLGTRENAKIMVTVYQKTLQISPDYNACQNMCTMTKIVIGENHTLETIFFI